MAREPGYCLHKPTGQAYVRFNGKLHYLGPYGSDESKERYNRLKAEWLVNRQAEKFQSTGPTVADVCLAFLAHAETYYATSDEAYQYKLAIRPLSDLYATLPAKSFGVVEFRTVRQWWLNRDVGNVGKRSPKKASQKPTEQKPTRKCSRNYINKMMKRILRVFRWATGEGMIPPIADVLKCVDGLKRGRTEAPESKPITCVDDKLVEATIPHLTKVVADMVRFQQLVGCRPGELVRITPSMVDRSGDVWTVTLKEHKTAYKNKSRTLYIGPKAQAILKQYLLRGGDDACFSPQESERQRLAAKHEKRVTPLGYGNSPGTNRLARKPRKAPRAAFDTNSYSNSIRYACRRAKLDHWHPNQLRHSAATSVRREFGIDAASVILGHSSLDVTQIYAEQDVARAKDIARRIG
jgi:integrase